MTYFLLSKSFVNYAAFIWGFWEEYETFFFKEMEFLIFMNLYVYNQGTLSVSDKGGVVCCIDNHKFLLNDFCGLYGMCGFEVQLLIFISDSLK